MGRIAREITRYLENADQAVSHYSETPLEYAKTYIPQFSPYRYVISCLFRLLHYFILCFLSLYSPTNYSAGIIWDSL